jgi:hypothetical protein
MAARRGALIGRAKRRARPRARTLADIQRKLQRDRDRAATMQQQQPHRTSASAMPTRSSVENTRQNMASNGREWMSPSLPRGPGLSVDNSLTKRAGRAAARAARLASLALPIASSDSEDVSAMDEQPGAIASDAIPALSRQYHQGASADQQSASDRPGNQPALEKDQTERGLVWEGCAQVGELLRLSAALPASAVSGWVYLVPTVRLIEGRRYCKVGISRDPDERFKSLCTNNPHALDLTQVRAFRGNHALETALKVLTAQHSTDAANEWRALLPSAYDALADLLPRLPWPTPHAATAQPFPSSGSTGSSGAERRSTAASTMSVWVQHAGWKRPRAAGNEEKTPVDGHPPTVSDKMESIRPKRRRLCVVRRATLQHADPPPSASTSPSHLNTCGWSRRARRAAAQAWATMASANSGLDVAKILVVNTPAHADASGKRTAPHSSVSGNRAAAHVSGNRAAAHVPENRASARASASGNRAATHASASGNRVELDNSALGKPEELIPLLRSLAYDDRFVAPLLIARSPDGNRSEECESAIVEEKGNRPVVRRAAADRTAAATAKQVGPVQSQEMHPCADTLPSKYMLAENFGDQSRPGRTSLASSAGDAGAAENHSRLDAADAETEWCCLGEALLLVASHQLSQPGAPQSATADHNWTATALARRIASLLGPAVAHHLPRRNPPAIALARAKLRAWLDTATPTTPSAPAPAPAPAPALSATTITRATALILP